ncbi:MAG: hypothetical protein MI744_07215, partial [Pseudomonadales bacterium]|nr:hypothetical protein [Pseudomonadales bacterium]
MAGSMFKKLWNSIHHQQKSRKLDLNKKLKSVERQIEQLVDRIVDTDNQTLISTYEKKITKLEGEKAIIGEKIKNSGKPVRSYDQTVRTALEFLSNPHKLWASERFEDKRMVLKLVFTEKLEYLRNSGLRTASIALPFKALEGFSV